MNIQKKTIEANLNKEGHKVGVVLSNNLPTLRIILDDEDNFKRVEGILYTSTYTNRDFSDNIEIDYWKSDYSVFLPIERDSEFVDALDGGTKYIIPDINKIIKVESVTEDYYALYDFDYSRNEPKDFVKKDNPKFNCYTEGHGVFELEDEYF